MCKRWYNTGFISRQPKSLLDGKYRNKGTLLMRDPDLLIDVR